jgi:hypothetical protein
VRGVRRWATVAVMTPALACAFFLLGAASLSGPALAFDQWEHDGTTGCSCHLQGKPTDASCTQCHTKFVSLEGRTCWTCHYPGQDTSDLSSTSADCAAECHLQSRGPVFDTPFEHGDNPHLGSLPQCLGCHSPSDSVTEPGASPHHNGGAVGMTPCSRCHKQQKQHVGKVACLSCHADANAFHTYQATSPGYTQCRTCHAKRHAGRNVPQNKCATCHKGTGTGASAVAQHSTTVTKRRTCNQSGCHSKQLHASRRGSGIKTCSSCHKNKYHLNNIPAPRSSICLSCHPGARRHTDHYACSTCHASLIHSANPYLHRIR